MPETPSAPSRVVLVGGGHAHVQLLRRFAMHPLPAAELTVVLDRPDAVYSGMVPGLVAGQYSAPEIEIDVVPLARRARARVVLEAAVGVDPKGQQILFRDRPSLRYDVASLDVGSTVAGRDTPGVNEHALATRPIADLVRGLDVVLRRAERADSNAPFRVVVVGGGVGGVELAFTLRHRLSSRAPAGVDTVLIEDCDRVLATYSEAFSARVESLATARGVSIVSGRRVVAVSSDSVTLDDDSVLGADAVLWVTGAVATDVVRRSDLPRDERGFVEVGPTLQVRGHPTLFAVGDCATLSDHPTTPKAGVYAVRQGPVLADNLVSFLRGRGLRRYLPQRDFLTLINLGDGDAVGVKWGRVIEGGWVMQMKDAIDRRFMRRFQVLEASGAMTPAFAAEPEMEMDPAECGGCAAKIGQGPLERALARLEPRRDDSVRMGLDQRDDASAYETPRGDLVVSSLDAFRGFTDDPWLVGGVAAVNAVSDLYAKGATPRHALALVALPADVEGGVAEDLLHQVLAGARAALDPIGVTLLGGHTTTAAELLVGFSVDGIARDAGALLRIDGLIPGQRLVLTKGSARP